MTFYWSCVVAVECLRIWVSLSSSTAAPLYLRLHHRFLQSSISNATIPPASPAPMTMPVFHLPPTLDSFFSPSVRKSARYPAWKFRRGFTVATRPRRRCVARGSQLLCCLTRTTQSRPKKARSTAQCSVWLNVMRQQRYRTTKLRRTLWWLKFAAERNMMHGDTAGSSSQEENGL